MKKNIIVGVLTLACVAALSAGFIIWRSNSARDAELAWFRQIKTALTAGHVQAAQQLLQDRPLSAGAVPARDLAEMEIAVLSQTEPPLINRLTALYWRAPEVFANQERASLLVARALLNARDLENLKTLRVKWFDRESLKPGWYQLDVDALIATGRKAEAEKVLANTQLPGAPDAERLTRLALLKAESEPEEAAKLLAAAVATDPKSAKVRIARGQFLEGQKKFELARAEYTAAFAVQPESDFYRDQLGEFYRRYGKYDEALQVWSAGLKEQTPPDFMLLKTLFWSRMVRPIREEIPPAPSGDLSALVQFVQDMPDGYSWRDDSFATVPEARRFEQTRQEVFWFKVFSALKQGDESKALGLLTYNPFQERSWNPDLERALLRTLVYRSSGTLKFPIATKTKLANKKAGKRHIFFEELNRWTGINREELPPEMAALLDSPHGISAAFLAAGWREAALQLGERQPLTPSLPGWYPYELGQALFVNYGADKALDYAKSHAAYPPLQLLRGELMLAKGRGAPAAELLKAATPALPPALAPRGALMLAVAYMTVGNFAEAEQVLKGNAHASGSAPGRDLLKKIADKKAASEKAFPLAAAGGLGK